MAYAHGLEYSRPDSADIQFLEDDGAGHECIGAIFVFG